MRRKVLFYEPDPIVRTALQRNLEEGGYDTYGVSCFAEIAELLPAEITIVDMNGIYEESLQLFRYIRSGFKDAVIIAIVPHQDPEQWYQILESGANYCLMRGNEPEFILRNIGIELDSCTERMQGDLYYAGDLMINLTQERVFRGFEEVYLTANEFEILSLLIKANGKFVLAETLQQTSEYDCSVRHCPGKGILFWMLRPMNRRSTGAESSVRTSVFLR